MLMGISETIYEFKELVDDLNKSKSLRSMLNKEDRVNLKEINIALQTRLGPASSIHIVSDFLDTIKNKEVLARKFDDATLSELQSIGNKLITLQFCRQKS